jgi:hypothetical protein
MTHDTGSLFLLFSMLVYVSIPLINTYLCPAFAAANVSPFPLDVEWDEGNVVCRRISRRSDLLNRQISHFSPKG